MKDHYTHQEVLKILECIQWLALSKGLRLMPIGRTFIQHSNTIITICISTHTTKETIDNLIEQSNV